MLLGMGRVELQRARPGKALQFLDRAATIAPELNEVHYYRGRALRGLGRPDEALRAYGVEVSHQPLHFGAHLDRAVLLAGLGRHAEAIESLRAALRARPGSRQVRLLLARTLLASADPDGPRADDHRTDMETLEEARRLAEEVVEVADEPDLRRRGHALLARILRALGRGDEARAHEEAAAGLVGDS